jgi:hypothetical protein
MSFPAFAAPATRRPRRARSKKPQSGRGLLAWMGHDPVDVDALSNRAGSRWNRCLGVAAARTDGPLPLPGIQRRRRGDAGKRNPSARV